MSTREAASWIVAGGVALAEIVAALLPQSSWPMILSSGGLMVFLLCHGGLTYGWRGAVAFLACVYPVAFAFEALSVATGFPFGRFTHHSPGAQLLGVPPTVPILYATAGYLAWSIAQLLIVGDRCRRLIGAQRFVVAPVAALVLAGYDVVFDPSGATLHGGWSFQTPSGLYGVPLTNFLGWILTGWVAFQIFACLAPPARTLGKSWVLPPILWLGLFVPSVSAFIVGPVPATDAVTIADRTFLAADIQETAVIVGMFSMGIPALATLAQVLSHRRHE